jgi:hypothetical protein
MGEDEQVAMSPGHGFGSRGDPNLFMVGVNVYDGRCLSGDATPLHGQVALSPGQGFGSRGDPNLPILPIKGRGFEALGP